MMPDRYPRLPRMAKRTCRPKNTLQRVRPPMGQEGKEEEPRPQQQRPGPGSGREWRRGRRDGQHTANPGPWPGLKKKQLLLVEFSQYSVPSFFIFLKRRTRAYMGRDRYLRTGVCRGLDSRGPCSVMRVMDDITADPRSIRWQLDPAVRSLGSLRFGGALAGRSICYTEDTVQDRKTVLEVELHVDGC